MKKTNQYMKYKGYEGSIEYTLEDKILFGKVQGIKSLISYEGNTIDELEKDFQGAIDDYLMSCKEDGVIPEKPFKGNFNVRIDPSLHEKLANYAATKHQSLNASVEEAIKRFLAQVKDAWNFSSVFLLETIVKVTEWVYYFSITIVER